MNVFDKSEPFTFSEKVLNAFASESFFASKLNENFKLAKTKCS